MAQGTFVKEGLAIDYTPDDAVTGGDVVVQNNVVGIAKTDIAASALGALAISGVFDVVKAEEAFETIGANIFWDEDGSPYGGTASSGAATATATSNTWMGFVLATADSTDATVRILLRSTVTLTAEEFSLADLSDIDAVDYTAGDVLIANGTKYVDLPLSGPFNLSAAGLLSMDSATVAATGSDQAGAAPIADGFTLVTAGNDAKGVKLPTAVAGGLHVVKNNADAVLLLYPFTGDAIDALGANNAMSVPAYATVRLVAYDATTWYSECFTLASLGNVGTLAYTAGKILVADGDSYEELALSGPFNLSAAGLLSMDAATVAAAGSAQGDAAAIADGLTLVSAADGTKGVKLPTAAAGGLVVVKNNAAAILKVYPFSGDAIDALGTNAALSVPAYGSVRLVAYDATTWYGAEPPATNTATVAALGSDQAGAAQLALGFTLVTAADATKGVKLPAAAPGLMAIVKNEDSADAVLKLYPATGDAINAGATNAALAMAAKTSCQLTAYDTTTWYTVPLVPS